MTNNTHPSNLKVRRLTELPQIPQEEIGESVLYATANNKDYKVGTTTYVDAVVEQLGDELAGIGEVRDEAVEARNDAVVASGAAAASAIEAASSATAAEQHAEDSESHASAAEESANLAEQARLSGPPIGYATRAEMEGNTSEDEGALALVTNDPIPDNNGTWRWSGAAWVQSADRVTVLESTTDRLIPSSKNLFSPRNIIVGRQYLASGAVQVNPTFRVTPRYSVTGGEKIALSGMNATVMAPGLNRFMHFWSGDTFVAAHPLIHTDLGMDHMVVEVPAGADGFSVNLGNTSEPLPPKFQIEKSARPTAYEANPRPSIGLAEAELDERLFVPSAKNLYAGAQGSRFLDNARVAKSGDARNVISLPVPVEYGKTYTVSGLSTAPHADFATRRVRGVQMAASLPLDVTESFGDYTGSTHTFTVSNTQTTHVVVQLAAFSDRFQEAFELPIQIEEGSSATEYEPPVQLVGLGDVERRMKAYTDAAISSVVPSYQQTLVLDQLSGAGPGITPSAADRTFGPYGAAYSVDSDLTDDAKGTALFTSVTGLKEGRRSIYAHLRCLDEDGASRLPAVAAMPFNVPSGQLVHEGPTAGWDRIGWKDDYVHPSIAYDATGVAGYKYWMVTSILPGYSTGGAVWEDEDIFVSNDAKTWLRIRSLYEADRPDTAPGLTLPPHNLVASGGRRYGFLPCPAAGDTLEISVPADNGAPELDRENITLTGNPWKHDPAILIDGGYVYIYHTFHLPYADRDGGKNRFVVCTRTNDGVNWECVRSDGSTLPLNTAAASRQMFTKDASGRYNYLLYRYNVNKMNPEVVRYGAGDYEFVYGYNFTERFKGTTPWNFDFTTPYPFQSSGSGNHPGLLHAGGYLYMLNQTGLYRSSNRGESFTKLAHYPTWRGGVSGTTYKKAMCVGDGGRVIVLDTASQDISAAAAPTTGQYRWPQRRNKMVVQEFPSLGAFTGFAENGLRDGYMDLQVDQVNYTNGERRSHFFPYIGNSATTSVVLNPHQRVKVGEIDVAAGDVLQVFLSLTARAGGRVSFNGLEIE